MAHPKRNRARGRNTKRGKSKHGRTNVRTKKRTKNSYAALRQIRDQQRSIDLCIRRLPFARLVREITEGIEDEYHIGPMRWQATAIKALQHVAESYLIGLFQDSMLCTLHAKCVTLKVEDMRLVRKIWGERALPEPVDD